MRPSLLLLAASLAASPAAAQNAFDGAWSVTITCTAARDGAAGYILRFPALVVNGQLRGHNKAPGQPGFLDVSGPIAPDGTAMLQAQGLTASPIYSVGAVPPLMPVSYHIKAAFQGNRGTGARIELRPCDATFTRP